LSVRLRVRDEQLQTYLYGEPARNDAVLSQWQEEGGAETRNQMRLFAPIGKTGQYRESIITRNTPKGFTTYPNTPIAPYIERGTQPHIITPKTAKALRWFGAYGNPIFARQVKHPGTKAQWVVRRTWEQMRPVLAELYKSIWRLHH
jgi:hypothetical protein